MIVLPDHPWFPNDAMTPDPALLDELASGESGTVERLLFGRVPLRLFGEALTGDLESSPVAGALWIMHLSGYFGGVWLRREIARDKLRRAIGSNHFVQLPQHLSRNEAIAPHTR
jgi:hypothetical protein